MRGSEYETRRRRTRKQPVRQRFPVVWCHDLGELVRASEFWKDVELRRGNRYAR